MMPQLLPLGLMLPQIGGCEAVRRLRPDQHVRLFRALISRILSEEVKTFKDYNLAAKRFVQGPMQFDQPLAAAGKARLYWPYSGQAERAVVSQ